MNWIKFILDNEFNFFSLMTTISEQSRLPSTIFPLHTFLYNLWQRIIVVVPICRRHEDSSKRRLASCFLNGRARLGRGSKKKSCSVHSYFLVHVGGTTIVNFASLILVPFWYLPLTFYWVSRFFFTLIHHHSSEQFTLPAILLYTHSERWVYKILIPRQIGQRKKDHRKHCIMPVLLKVVDVPVHDYNQHRGSRIMMT